MCSSLLPFAKRENIFRKNKKLFQLIIVRLLRGTEYENPDGCEVDKFFISFFELELTGDFCVTFFESKINIWYDEKSSFFVLTSAAQTSWTELGQGHKQFPREIEISKTSLWENEMRNEIISMISEINLIVKHEKQSKANHNMIYPSHSLSIQSHPCKPSQSTTTI